MTDPKTSSGLPQPIVTRVAFPKKYRLRNDRDAREGRGRRGYRNNIETLSISGYEQNANGHKTLAGREDHRKVPEY